MDLLDVEKVGDKTRQGLKWVFSLQILQKIFFFTSTVLLARLLTPADFGLATMSITLDTITWLVLSLGVNSAVMYFQDNIEERLNAAFWLYLVSSIFFVTVEILAAPVVAYFYKEPMLIPIIRYSAIALFITSFGAIQKTILSKSLDYKKISILDAFTNILLNIFYITFALLGFGVWSFIYPKIIVAIVQVTCLWNMSKWHPVFKFYFEYWKEMLNYGKNVLFSSIIDYTLNNSTYILIGGMIGATSLGLYTFAYSKSMMVVNNIANPISAISFPAFARLQNHRERLKNAFFKSVKMITLISFPYGFYQFVIGPEFITTIFGNKWIPAIIIFQIIAGYSMFRSIVLNGSPVLEATGKPNIVLRYNIIFAPVYLGSIYLGYKVGGMYGIGAATAVIGIMGSLAYLAIILKNLNWSINEVYLTIKPALFSSLIMAAVLFVAKILLKSLHSPDVFILLTLLPFGMFIYASIIRLLFRDTYEFILENVVNLIGAKMSNIFLRNTGKA